MDVVPFSRIYFPSEKKTWRIYSHRHGNSVETLHGSREWTFSDSWKLTAANKNAWGWYLDTTEVLTYIAPEKCWLEDNFPKKEGNLCSTLGGGVSFFWDLWDLFLYTQWTSFLLAKTSSLPAQGKAVGGLDMRYITTRPKRWPQTSVGGTEFLLTCCKFVDFTNSTEFFEFCTTED